MKRSKVFLKIQLNLYRMEGKLRLFATFIRLNNPPVKL